MSLIKGKQIASNSVNLNKVDWESYTVGDSISGISPGKTPINKEYADSIAAGLDYKESVDAATTADLGATYVFSSASGAPASGEFTGDVPNTIDGLVLQVGDRVLVKNQTDLTQNGIYEVTDIGAGGPGGSTTTMQRAQDHDGSPTNEVSGGNSTFVKSGTVNGSTGYVLEGNGENLILNTDNLSWIQYTAIGSFVGTDGIDISGQNISVDLATDSGLEFNTGQLRILNSSGIIRNASGISLDVDYTLGQISTQNLAIAEPIDVYYNGAGKLQIDESELTHSAPVNGLSFIGAPTNKEIGLGGSLTQNTDLDLNNFELAFSDTANGITDILRLSNVNGILADGNSAIDFTVENFSNVNISGSAVGIKQTTATANQIDVAATSTSISSGNGAESIVVSDTGITINNTVTSGIEYAAEPTAYQAQSLVTKQFVDDAFAGYVITAGSGTSPGSATSVDLGGILTEDFDLDGSASNFDVRFGFNNDLGIFDVSAGDIFLDATTNGRLAAATVDVTGSTQATIERNANQGLIMSSLNTSLISDVGVRIDSTGGSMIQTQDDGEFRLTQNNSIPASSGALNFVALGPNATSGTISLSTVESLTPGEDTTTMTVSSNATNFAGLEYGADYSAQFTNRSLVDKEYVDSQITGAALTFQNGLTETSGTVELGGTMLSDITLNRDAAGAQDFIIQQDYTGGTAAQEYYQGARFVSNDTGNGDNIALTLYSKSGANSGAGAPVFGLGANDTIDTGSYIRLQDDAGSDKAAMGHNGTNHENSIKFFDNQLTLTSNNLSNTSTFTMNSQGATFSAPLSSTSGIEYAADYSGNFSSRSLVDKGYVDSLVGNGFVDGEATTFVPGASPTFNLGGSFTSDVSISSTAGDLTFQISQEGADGSDAYFTSFYQTGVTNGYDTEAISALYASNDNTFLSSVTPLGADGTIKGAVIEAMSIDAGNENRVRVGGWNDTNNFNGLYVQTGSADEVVLQYNAVPANANDITLDDNGITVTGTGSFSGIRYAADYSSNFVPRSLVDKAYVDSAITAGGVITGSGITIASNQANLGGTLTQDATLTGVFDVNIGTSGSRIDTFNMFASSSLGTSNQSIETIDNAENVEFAIKSTSNGEATALRLNAGTDGTVAIEATADILLDSIADAVRLSVAPTGGTSLAVATTGYVDAAVSGATLTDGSGTTANGTAVDLGGTLSSNATFVGGGFDVTFGDTTDLGAFNINSGNITQAATGDIQLTSALGFVQLDSAQATLGIDNVSNSTVNLTAESVDISHTQFASFGIDAITSSVVPNYDEANNTSLADLRATDYGFQIVDNTDAIIGGGEIVVGLNTTGNYQVFSTDENKKATIIGSRNSAFLTGINNSVIAGGDQVLADASNTLFAQNISGYGSITSNYGDLQGNQTAYIQLYEVGGYAAMDLGDNWILQTYDSGYGNSDLGLFNNSSSRNVLFFENGNRVTVDTDTVVNGGLGMQYAFDYSTANAGNDRWMVDKGYVDSQISAATPNGIDDVLAQNQALTNGRAINLGSNTYTIFSTQNGGRIEMNLQDSGDNNRTSFLQTNGIFQVNANEGGAFLGTDGYWTVDINSINNEAKFGKFSTNGANAKYMEISNTDWEIIDGVSQQGMRYAGDYSAANTTNDRWIVDKGYVDSQISASTFTLTDGSGTTANGTAVDLGGVLTANTNILTTGGENINIYSVNGSNLSGFNTIPSNGEAKLYANTGGGGTGASEIISGETELSIIRYDVDTVGNSASLVMNNTSNVFTDGINSKGLEYAADYSTANAANDRWIVDKGYVDSEISASTFTLTDGNATTANGTAADINVGGTGVTGTSIDLDIAGSNLVLDSAKVSAGLSSGAAVGNFIALSDNGSGSLGIDSQDITTGLSAGTAATFVQLTDDGAGNLGIDADSISANISLNDGSGLTFDTVGDKYDLGGTLTQNVDFDGTFDFTLGGTTPLSNISFTTSGNATVDGAVTTVSGTDGQFVIGSSGNIFTDLRSSGSQAGIEYAADYSADFTARSLVDKEYVDGIAAGITVKSPVRVKTVAALPAYIQAGAGENATLTATGSGVLPAIDSITLTVGDRILVTTEATVTDTNNGIYEVTDLGSGSTPWILTRSADADGTPNGEVKGGMFVFVEEGTTYADTGWVLSTNGVIDVDTDVQNFVQFSSAGIIQAGTGLTKTGNTLDVNTTGGTPTGTAIALSIDSDNIVLDSDDVVSQFSGGASVGTFIQLADNGAGALGIDADQIALDIVLSDGNGLTFDAANDAYNLGGTLTQATTITDGRTAGSQAGIEYAADYSADFTARSLVDKGYVDTEISNATPTLGAAGQIAYTNGTADDLAYSASFLFDDSVNGDLTLGGSLTTGDNIGEDASITLGTNVSDYAQIDLGGSWFIENQDAGGLIDLAITNGTTNIITINSNGNMTYSSAGTGGNEGIQYAADYSASNTANDRWLVDKGYVDTAITDNTQTFVSGSGTTFVPGEDATFDLGGTLTQNALIDGAFDLTVGGTTPLTAYTVNSSGAITLNGDTDGVANSMVLDATGVAIDTGTGSFVVTDSRTVGSQAGIEYAADYSADYTARSLVDKGFVQSLSNGQYGAVYVVDIVNGNDGTAEVNSLTNTYLTINAAADAAETFVAANGQKAFVYVKFGTYNEANITRNKVDMYFEEDTLVYTSSAGVGVLTDADNSFPSQGGELNVYGKGIFAHLNARPANDEDSLNIRKGTTAYIEAKDLGSIQVWQGSTIADVTIANAKIRMFGYNINGNNKSLTLKNVELLAPVRLDTPGDNTTGNKTKYVDSKLRLLSDYSYDFVGNTANATELYRITDAYNATTIDYIDPATSGNGFLSNEQTGYTSSDTLLSGFIPIDFNFQFVSIIEGNLTGSTDEHEYVFENCDLILERDYTIGVIVTQQTATSLTTLEMTNCRIIDNSANGDTVGFVIAGSGVVTEDMNFNLRNTMSKVTTRRKSYSTFTDLKSGFVAVDPEFGGIEAGNSILNVTPADDSKKLGYNATTGKFELQTTEIPAEQAIEFDANSISGPSTDAEVTGFFTATDGVYDWNNLDGPIRLFVNGLSYRTSATTSAKAPFWFSDSLGGTKSDVPTATLNRLFVSVDDLGFDLDTDDYIDAEFEINEVI